MRLGLRNTIWQPDSEWSKLRALYSESSTSEALSNGVTSSSHLMNGASNETANGTPVSAPFISERHRHRYEVNPSKIHALPGLHFVGSKRVPRLFLTNYAYPIPVGRPKDYYFLSSLSVCVMTQVSFSEKNADSPYLSEDETGQRKSCPVIKSSVRQRLTLCRARSARTQTTPFLCR